LYLIDGLAPASELVGRQVGDADAVVAQGVRDLGGGGVGGQQLTAYPENRQKSLCSR